MKKTITKEFDFDSSHRLVNKELSDEDNIKIFGKCNNIPSHGHTYKLWVTVSGEEKNGMIVNFLDLKDVVNKNVIDVFDHHFINDLDCMKEKISTCENMLDVIWNLLYLPFKQMNLTLVKIKLSETPTSWGELGIG